MWLEAEIKKKKKKKKEIEQDGLSRLRVLTRSYQPRENGRDPLYIYFLQQ